MCLSLAKPGGIRHAINLTTPRLLRGRYYDIIMQKAFKLTPWESLYLFSQPDVRGKPMKDNEWAVKPLGLPCSSGALQQTIAHSRGDAGSTRNKYNYVNG